ncbi:Protein MAM3 [Lasiodiplodia hormozganensis]|uniref:Protein MAM3 n=1 Tax=Lasiodiplodia hormozganensis TaxID=869390 RepID=A0AA39Y3P7_9PEZI|nr:Protein MAM3 [Lasiodiplodia hormozganensis]
MGQDEIFLQVLAVSGNAEEQKNAALVLRLLQKGKHWVLVTLLLSNVITNETLPIVLDRSLGGGIGAVVSSTVLIVIFGEILPQSVCVRYGLPIGAWMAPLVLMLMWILCPVAWPTAKLLDYLLGEDQGTVYKRAGLKALVTLHKSLGIAEDRLNQDEVTIIGAVLDLKDKPVGSIMTPIDDVFTMSADTTLDEDTVNSILSAGYSRIPIHSTDNARDFVGMLLVKLLITYDPEDCKRVSDFTLATLPETRPETSCLDIINFFQEGKSHMVVVSNFPGEAFGTLGVVTLEDVVEELIGEEIIDEADIRRGNGNWRKPLPVKVDNDLERKKEPRIKLGPSNAASDPKSTRISTVKIKRSTGSMLEAAVASDQRGCRTPLLGNEHGQRARPIPIPPPATILEKTIARSGSLSESIREVDGVKKVVLDVLND